MAGRLDWESDGADWPNRSASRFVEAGGLTWHVQVAGDGPAVLLLHGTGASTHSWSGMLPLVAAEFTAVSPDLPGHAFTSIPDSAGLSLPGMARAVAALMDAMAIRPAVLVGHSAGAAIAIRMALDGLVAPRAIVSINGALLPPQGVVGPFFSPIAKLLALNPLVPRVFAWQARTSGAVDRLLAQTGSTVAADSAAIYRLLMRTPGHVAGALGMMANWDLGALLDELPALKVPLTLVVGGEDDMVPPENAFQIRRLVGSASVVYLRGLGHLAHEEDPARIAEIVHRVAVLTALGASDDEPAGEPEP